MWLWVLGFWLWGLGFRGSGSWDFDYGCSWACCLEVGVSMNLAVHEGHILCYISSHYIVLCFFVL